MLFLNFTDKTEAKEIHSQLLKPPSHALVRTLDTDAFTIVELDNVVKRNGWLFQHENDYDDFQDYEITEFVDDKPRTVPVQILKTGRE